MQIKTQAEGHRIITANDLSVGDILKIAYGWYLLADLREFSDRNHEYRLLEIGTEFHWGTPVDSFDKLFEHIPDNLIVGVNYFPASNTNITLSVGGE